MWSDISVSKTKGMGFDDGLGVTNATPLLTEGGEIKMMNS